MPKTNREHPSACGCLSASHPEPHVCSESTGAVHPVGSELKVFLLFLPIHTSLIPTDTQQSGGSPWEG